MAKTTHIAKQEEGQTENSVQLRATDPGSPVTDQLWLNTSDNKIKYYNGASTVETVAGISPTLYQINILSADVTSVSAVSDLSFTNLNIGETYRISYTLRFAVNGGTGGIKADASHDGSKLMEFSFDASDSASGLEETVQSGQIIFVATATSLSFQTSLVDTNASLKGDGTTAESFCMIEELSNYNITGSF